MFHLFIGTLHSIQSVTDIKLPTYYGSSRKKSLVLDDFKTYHNFPVSCSCLNFIECIGNGAYTGEIDIILLFQFDCVTL